MNSNRVIGIILLAFIIWWGYLTSNLPPSTMPGEPGPKFFPFVILGLMALASAVLVLYKPKKETANAIQSDEIDNEHTEPEEEFAMIDVLKLFAIFLGGIILIRYVGFNIGLIISLSIMLWFIGWKLFPRAILFSATVTLAIYFLFTLLLKIPLPKGSLF